MGLGSLVGKASHTLFSLYAHFAMHTCLYVYEEKLKACMGKCPSMACFISIGIHSVRLMYLPGSSRGALIGVPCEECLLLFWRWGYPIKYRHHPLHSSLLCIRDHGPRHIPSQDGFRWHIWNHLNLLGYRPGDQSGPQNPRVQRCWEL